MNRIALPSRIHKDPQQHYPTLLKRCVQPSECFIGVTERRVELGDRSGCTYRRCDSAINSARSWGVFVGRPASAYCRSYATLPFGDIGPTFLWSN